MKPPTPAEHKATYEVALVISLVGLGLMVGGAVYWVGANLAIAIGAGLVVTMLPATVEYYIKR